MRTWHKLLEISGNTKIEQTDPALGFYDLYYHLLQINKQRNIFTLAYFSGIDQAHIHLVIEKSFLRIFFFHFLLLILTDQTKKCIASVHCSILNKFLINKKTCVLSLTLVI